MAPYIEPKSVRMQKRDKPASAPMTKLADELLLDVVERLPITDILSLRLTCKKFVPATNTALKKRLTTLYIHPSATSLKNAVDICNHPVLSQQIDKVILLGSPKWREIEKAYPGYRRFGPAAYLYGGGDPNLGEVEYSSLPAWHTVFRAWPLWLPESKTRKGGSLETVHCETDPVAAMCLPLDETYAPLIEALQRLPKLHILSFSRAPSASTKGLSLNRPHQSIIDAHATKCASIPRHFLDQYGRWNKGAARLAVRRSDAEILYGLLLNPRLRFTAFTQHTELPFIEDVMGYIEPPHPKMPSPSTSLVGSITRIQVYVDMGWELTDQRKFYRHLIQAASSTLHHLHFKFAPNASVVKAEMDGAIDHIIGKAVFSNLETLEIEQLEALPLADATKQGKHKDRIIPRCERPSCQLLTPSVRKVICGVKVFRLKNVVFDEIEPFVLPRSFNVAATTRSVLEDLKKESTTLERFEWIVPLFRHDPRCKRADGDTMQDCRKFQCGIYNNAGAFHSTDDEVVIMAREMGLGIDLETGLWDFAEHVMRAPVNEEGELEQKFGMLTFY